MYFTLLTPCVIDKREIATSEKGTQAGIGIFSALIGYGIPAEDAIPPGGRWVEWGAKTSHFNYTVGSRN